MLIHNHIIRESPPKYCHVCFQLSLCEGKNKKKMSIRYIGVYKTFYKKTKLVVYPPQEHIMIF